MLPPNATEELLTNPVTQTLLEELRRPEVSEFVAAWDRLEARLVSLYKGTGEQSQSHQATDRNVAWLADHYLTWQTDLEPHWRNLAADPEHDPFARILSDRLEESGQVSWDTLRELPHAREALNSWIMSLLVEETSSG